MARNSSGSRPPSSSKHRKPIKSVKKFNASGYAKRHAQKAAKSKARSDDFYEYAPEKSRRAKIGLDLDREEALDAGIGPSLGSDDEGDFEDFRKKPRLIGENDEDDEIASEDDEEIDSDAAFEEEDEDRFAGFFSSRSNSEDDNSDALEDESEEDEESDEDEKISISLSDAEEEATGALDDLQNFISSLDPSSSGNKRKASMDGGDFNNAPTQSKKRRVLRERTEAGTESEFRTKGAGLTLTDLLAPLGESSTSVSSLEKSVRALQPSSGEASKKRPQTLSAPLPQRAQERLDREAAYEQTKEEVNKWNSTMKRIQEAEHLSFPLQAQSQGKVSNLELAAKFKPTTDLEMTVSRLLASANMATDASVLQTEENMLKANALSVEEVTERRRELRRMRELMFRAEVKAKRVKKIKSKVYRRLRRKERNAGEGAEDPDEDNEEKRLRMERDRARERATLKHKNTGKWAQQMKKRNGYGEDDDDEGMRSGRAEIEDMLTRGEKLRRRIQGQDSGSEDDSDDTEEDDDDAEAAFNELQELRNADDDQDAEAAGKKGKSVFEMKFMKDAMIRRQHEANKMVDDFVKEMGGDLREESEGGDDDGEIQDDSSVVVSRAGGRMIFKPGASISHQQQVSNNGDAASAASSSTLKSNSPTSPITSTSGRKNSSRSLLSQPQASFSANATLNADINPWLAGSSESHKAPRKKNEVIVAKDSSAMAKSKNKLKKEARKAAGEKEKANDDAVVEIQMNNVLSLAGEDAGADSSTTRTMAQGKKSGDKGKQKALSSAEVQQDTDEDSDANSEVEEQERTLLKSKKGQKLQAIEQRELVARAFAGDNVVKAFEDAKRAEIAADAPKEVDTTLPGWGSWGGAGTTKVKPKSHLIKKVAGIDPKSRADYGKGHVIISEKKDKKAAKYLVKDLPYPYTSRAQFERRMEQPLGPEWNTRVGFQKGTLPKVVKKMGTVINPLEKLF
ncbi:small-subunit processome [Dendrothele bispora CBS 962.96]|uniref:Small-subunit processome n=1 Tax=Dendrothele bispora (strain CBS 962.96) TaxID=1314807 RepID=A0A4S8MW85_DENBC|nr:small-subunit processome [Dendrothele bispora CBS 962.96]